VVAASASRLTVIERRRTGSGDISVRVKLGEERSTVSSRGQHQRLIAVVSDGNRPGAARKGAGPFSSEDAELCFGKDFTASIARLATSVSDTVVS
jgi:hypothetical protein